MIQFPVRFQRCSEKHDDMNSLQPNLQMVHGMDSYRINFACSRLRICNADLCMGLLAFRCRCEASYRLRGSHDSRYARCWTTRMASAAFTRPVTQTNRGRHRTGGIGAESVRFVPSDAPCIEHTARRIQCEMKYKTNSCFDGH